MSDENVSNSTNDPNDSKKQSKEEAFWKVLNAAIELDFQHGHLNWSMTKLAKESGVSRPLIYHYFGSDKKNILLEAIRSIGEYFAGLSGEKFENYAMGMIHKSIIDSRNHLENAPRLAPYYYMYRNSDNEIGEAFRSIEGAFLGKIKHFFPSLKPEEQKALTCLIYGMAFAPNMNEEEIKAGVNLAMSTISELPSK